MAESRQLQNTIYCIQVKRQWTAIQFKFEVCQEDATNSWELRKFVHCFPRPQFQQQLGHGHPCLGTWLYTQRNHQPKSDNRVTIGLTLRSDSQSFTLRQLSHFPETVTVRQSICNSPVLPSHVNSKYLLKYLFKSPTSQFVGWCT